MYAVLHFSFLVSTSKCISHISRFLADLSDYDMTSTAAQSASSADMVLLWRLIVQDQEQHRMTRSEFIAFYKLMGMIEPFVGDAGACEL